MAEEGAEHLASRRPEGPALPLLEPMSLFKAREFWRAGGAAGEGYSEGALAVGNCDNDPTGAGARPARRPPRPRAASVGRRSLTV